MEATLVVANPDGFFGVVGFGHVVSLLRDKWTCADKLPTDRTADCVPLIGVGHEGGVGE